MTNRESRPFHWLYEVGNGFLHQPARKSVIVLFPIIGVKPIMAATAPVLFDTGCHLADRRMEGHDGRSNAEGTTMVPRFSRPKACDITLTTLIFGHLRRSSTLPVIHRIVVYTAQPARQGK
jgi:hypothetical protein